MPHDPWRLGWGRSSDRAAVWARLTQAERQAICDALWSTDPPERLLIRLEHTTRGELSAVDVPREVRRAARRFVPMWKRRTPQD